MQSHGAYGFAQEHLNELFPQKDWWTEEMVIIELYIYGSAFKKGSIGAYRFALNTHIMDELIPLKSKN